MIDLLHWLAGIVILAESLNKLERCNPLAKDLTCHARVVDTLKALAWGLLAQLWQELDQPLRAVRALGETRAAVGDLNGAIDRLRSGLNQSRGRNADQIEASVIDARLRSLIYERRQLMAELYPRGAPPGAELPLQESRPLSPRLSLEASPAR